jgi:hypothetical protein
LGDIEIRPYESGDEERIVGLLETVFNGWPSFDLGCGPLDHWRWKYLDNPLQKIAICVAEKGEEIVGCAHNVQQRVKIGGGLHLLPFGADAAVHPEYRKRGLHTRMGELKTEMGRRQGALPHYSVSANPVLIGRNLRRSRPRIAQPVSIFVKIKDVNRHIRMIPPEDSLLKKYGYLTLEKLNRLKNYARPEGRSSRDIEIRTIKSFDERIDTFWQEVSRSYDFIVERDRSRLNWRYCDHRAGPYLVRQAEEGGRVLGYSVLRVNRSREEYAVGFIVDLLTLEGAPDAAHALLGDAVDYFDRNEVNVVTGLIPKNSPDVKALRRHGFLDSRERINLFSWAMEVSQVNASSRMHFSCGDFDHI